MKSKVALARAKQALSPEIREHCPTEIPPHLDPEEDPTEVIGWLVGEAYVRYLMADGLPEEKARDIVTQLASSDTLSLGVIAPGEPTGSEAKGSKATG
jgi:hypothetical protein